MSQRLPRLRMNLDFMPSPVESHPGLLIRDSYGYSDATLIIPPALIQCLQYLDGEQTELDLRAELVRLTGELDTRPLEKHLLDSLSAAGFLEDETYERLRDERRRAFAEGEIREPTHAGTAYPDDKAEAEEMLRQYMNEAAPPLEGNIIGIAAPHVSPFGGWETYRAAYSALRPDLKDRTFVILGTSHYGEPDHFGLTRKRFATPFGEARTDTAIVDKFDGQPAVLMEDYCHAVEHSIEFQVLYLQYLFGADINIVPILCGSLHNGATNDGVQRFFGTLGEIAAKRSDLLWVLGIDMAHMGRRYGDVITAYADAGEMLSVAERDKQRIDRINAGDAAGFWELVHENGEDDLKWCGSSPSYTFLNAVPNAAGALRGYQQWNIDEQSVVSFGAIAFTDKT
jgi:AmmeMemoRadiSam system protein B